MDNNNLNIKNAELLKLIDNKSVFGRYYIKICEILKHKGVPSTRLPTLPHFMSRVFSCIDEKQMEDWIERFSKLERISSCEIEESNTDNSIDNDRDPDNNI